MRIRWRNFELPNNVQPDADTLTGEHGRFVIEPFERGFGHTIGNGLRRVLLSSIVLPCDCGCCYIVSFCVCHPFNFSLSESSRPL